MNDNRLQEIITELDREIPRDGAFAHIRTTDKAEVYLAVNNEGFQRLGVEFLKASFAPRHSTEDRFDVGLKNVMGIDSENFIQFGERGAPASEPVARKKTFRDRFKTFKAGVWTAIVVLFFIIPWVIGVACMWSAVL